MFVVPLAVLAAQVAVKLRAPAAYAALNWEDGPIEWLQVAVFVASAVLAGRAAWRWRAVGSRRMALLCAAAAAGFVAFAGEEVSWGQRLLDLAPPGFFAEHNVQHELTLHNLSGGSYVMALGYAAVSAWGAFAWLLAPRLRGRLGGVARLAPAWYLSPYFLVPGVTYAWFPLFEHVGYRLLGVAALHRGAFFDWYDQEPAELLLAVGLLLFVAGLDPARQRPPADGAGLS